MSSQVRNPAPGEPTPEADGFVSAEPSLRLVVTQSRALHTLEYTFTGYFYFLHTNGFTYANELAYSAALQPSSDVRLALGLSARQGMQQTISLMQSPATTQTQIRPSGETMYIIGAATEQLEWDITHAWRANQGLALNAFLPIESESPQSNNYSLDAELGLQRVWRVDALGARFRSGYIVNSEIEEDPNSPGSGQPLQQQLVFDLRAEWLRDLTPSWSFTLNGGSVAALALPSNEAADGSGGTGLFLHPVGRAAVQYRREPFTAEAAASHAVQPNIYLGNVFLEEQASFVGTTTLDRLDHLMLSAGVGYAYGRPMYFYDTAQHSAGDLGTGAHVLSADVELTWRANDYFTLLARYQFHGQWGGEQSSIEQPSQPEVDRTPTMTNHQILVGLRATYPRAGETLTLRVRPPGGVTREQWEQNFSVPITAEQPPPNAPAGSGQ